MNQGKFFCKPFQGSGKDKIRGKARHVISLADELADKAMNSARTMRLAAQESGMNAKNHGQQIIHDNPVAVRMAALGVGALMFVLIVLKTNQRILGDVDTRRAFSQLIWPLQT